MNNIKVETFSPNAGEFLGVYLSFKDLEGTKRKVKLKVDFRELYHFLRSDTSIHVDFFLIGSIVYGVDCLLKRYFYSYDGWSREIQVNIPVSNKDKWGDKTDEINELLQFLTGDLWNIEFSDLNQLKVYQKRKRDKANPKYSYKKYVAVSLFSGGLDSLAGIVDKVSSLKKGQKILLASHYDSSSGGPKKDQKMLYSELKKLYSDKIDWIQSQVSISRMDRKGSKVETENSYRSRSLLFISIANLLLSECSNAIELLVPENGSISLNHPLTKSRSSTLSTRTTHPHYLANLQSILNDLGIDVNIDNPFSFKTKGEVLAKSKNIKDLRKLYEKSVSCGKRGHRRYWDVDTGTDHCGVCMPCIYRRAGLHKINLDNQLYGTDILKKAKHPKDFPDLLALLEFLNADFSKEDIMSSLLINGSLPLNNLDDYADLVQRTIDEVKKWINDKGNNDLKNLLN